jgi:hypothetical protein
MIPHEENLAAVLRQHGLTAGVVVAADGSMLARVGDPGSVGCDTLLSALIGPYGNARVTFESLEGQLLPQMTAQGISFAFIDKASPDVMVIVFGTGLSAVDQYHLSKRVSAAIAERWMGEPPGALAARPGGAGG